MKKRPSSGNVAGTERAKDATIYKSGERVQRVESIPAESAVKVTSALVLPATLSVAIYSSDYLFISLDSGRFLKNET